MDDVIAALAEQQDELRGLIADLDDGGFGRPSRCAGWDVKDVVLHVTQTNDMAIGSATDRFAETMQELTIGLPVATDVDEGAALMVARDRALTGAEVRDRFDRGATRLLEVLSASDPHHRVTWVAGELTVRTLATTRLAETWIHTGDVAHALGVELAPAPRLRHVARLAWRTIPYAFARAGKAAPGPVAFHLRGPDGDTWDFTPEDAARTTVTGDGHELCLVAARRVAPEETSLVATGPDADDVLALVRTYA